MSNDFQGVVPRRIASAAVGLLGFWLFVDAVAVHVDGLRTRHIEYTQNILVFVSISVALVVGAGALLLTASRLWRVPDKLR